MDQHRIDPDRMGHVLAPDDGDYLRFERTFDQPPAEVWDALTRPERNEAWAVRTEYEPREGGAVTMPFGAAGEVISWDEPQLLEYAFDGDGGRWHVRIAIAELDSGSALTFDHVTPDPASADIAAGWHWYLDRLEELLGGGSPEQVASDAHFEELQRDYADARA